MKKIIALLLLGSVLTSGIFAAKKQKTQTVKIGV